jgi:hypothetical protein
MGQTHQLFASNAHGLTYHPMPDGGDNAWLGIQRFSTWPETRPGRLLHASSSPFAVLRLIASSNLTGAWTGSSLGFAPFDVDDEEARRAGSIRLHVPVSLSRNSSPPFFQPAWAVRVGHETRDRTAEPAGSATNKWENARLAMGAWRDKSMHDGAGDGDLPRL